jgi:phage major head subunit gpT-like protein
VSLTRQAIINDDLSAMERVPEMLGRGFRRLESNIIWGLITGNAVTSVDGVALFDAAHGNMGGVGGLSISTSGFNTARKAMRKQTDIAGNTINLQPSYLFAPTDLEATALQFLFPTGFAPAARIGDAGPAVQAQTAGVQLIVEPRLDVADDVWYLAASPGAVEGLVYGYLAGEEGPTVTTAEKRDPDGVELLARFDFGAAVKDFRGFYRSKNV